MTASDLDIDTVDHLLTTTRAVRKRLDLDRPVPREPVLECIRIGSQGPAGGNHHRLRWVIVDDPAAKQVVGDAYRRAYEPYIEAQRTAVAEKTPDNTTAGRIMSSSDYLAEVLADVPVLAIPCALGQPDDAGSWGSLLPSIWSYMLAARARGLGTVWTTLHLRHADDVARALDIPDTVTQLACIPTAYYTGETFKPGARRDAEEITYWNGWKTTG